MDSHKVTDDLVSRVPPEGGQGIAVINIDLVKKVRAALWIIEIYSRTVTITRNNEIEDAECTKILDSLVYVYSQVTGVTLWEARQHLTAMLRV